MAYSLGFIYLCAAGPATCTYPISRASACCGEKVWCKDSTTGLKSQPKANPNRTLAVLDGSPQSNQSRGGSEHPDTNNFLHCKE